MNNESWKRNVYLMWAAIFISAICWTMIMPFIPVFLKDELGVAHGAEAWAGIFDAIGSLAAALTAPIWGTVGDRFGRKPMLLRSGIFLAVSYASFSLIHSMFGLMATRIMIGALTGFIPMAIALVGTTTAQEHVGKALTIVSTAAPTGSIVGPFFGGLLSDLVGIRGTMVMGSVMIGIVTLMVFLTVKEQFTPLKRKPGGNMFTEMGEVFKNRAFVAIVITQTMFVASLFSMEPMLVPYIKSLLGEGTPNWLAGGLYAIPGIAFVLTASWWSTRAQKWGYHTTVTLGLALGALMVLPQVLADTAWLFGGLRLAQGVATASISPGITAMIALVVPQALRGRAFGINQSAFAVGAMLGPLMGGFLASSVGPKWVFPATAVLFLTAAAWGRFVVSPRVEAVRLEAA